MKHDPKTPPANPDDTTPCGVPVIELDDDTIFAFVTDDDIEQPFPLEKEEL